jgi:hypothetical protein
VKEWFNKYVLDVQRDEDGDCERIILFGLYIDFRQYYLTKNTNKDLRNAWWTEEHVSKVRKDEEKKNKRRKNKLPLTEFVKIPWYRTILEWPTISDNFREGFRHLFVYLLGLLTGIQATLIWGVN